MYNRSNVFYKIINEDLYKKLWIDSNNHAIAINDINPRAKIHILVIPKGNYKNVCEFIQKASIEEQSSFWKLANKIMENIEDFQLVINQGVGQEVPHLHLHILSGQLCD